jgi:hypothetical protein
MMPVIEDNIGAVVAKMRTLQGVGVTTPEYMYGHIPEINTRLQLKQTDPVNRDKKYPLVILRLDAVSDVVGDMVKYNLNLAIVNRTDQNYNAEQRLERVFKPILYPLFELFFEALQKSPLFMWPGDLRYPPHTKIDRYYWGTQSGAVNVKNIMSDPIDAIEIQNLKINSRIKNNC